MTDTVVTENNVVNTVTVDTETVATVVESAIQVVTVGIQGPAGATVGGYNHTQSSASTTWTINHNLGYRPSVELFSAGGAEIEGDVLHISTNQVVATFASSITGSARLI